MSRAGPGQFWVRLKFTGGGAPPSRDFSKPVDKFGNLVRSSPVQSEKSNKDSNGHYVTIPNSISLGPYNGRIIYPGQIASCFICQSPDHQHPRREVLCEIPRESNSPTDTKMDGDWTL
ncbi:hypothetical protein WMY93_008532 [Mugilogobius chulae]|uniref:Uncharacterized protein n=1 Tax=Mugilogobius chulae TaxID=88201 RepID=A0AAW0PJ92_9GOBI